MGRQGRKGRSALERRDAGFLFRVRKDAGHRTAVLEWKPRGKKEQEKEFELKLFVGPWRAAVDLVEHLQEGGWDFRDRRRPSTVLCFPQELMWPLEYAIDGTEVRLPVLLPPQE